MLRKGMEPLTPWAVGLTAFAAIVASIIVNLGGDPPAVRLGQAITRPIAARAAFEIVDPAQTEASRLLARETAPNVYVLDTALLDEIRGKLTSALTIAKSRPSEPDVVRQEAAANNVLLDDAGLEELMQLAAAPSSEPYQNSVDQVIRMLAATYLVEYAETSRKKAAEAILVDPREAEERRLPVKVGKLRYSNSADAVSEAVAEATRFVPQKLQPSLQASIIAMLKSGDPARVAWRGVYRYSAQRSQAIAEETAARVQPETISFAKGSLLVEPGAIDHKELELIQAEERAYLAELAARPTFSRDYWLRVAARAGLVFLVIFGVKFYLVSYQRSSRRTRFGEATAVLLMLAALGLSRFLVLRTELPPQITVGFMALVAAILALAYVRGSVFAVCSASGLLMALATGQGPAYLIALLAVVGTFVIGLSDVRRRGKIVLVGALAGAAALATNAAGDLLAGQPLRFVVAGSLWAAGSVLMAAFVVEGILPGIERLFGVATNLTLLEWCDANKPLLRLMAAEAPGTYNHSLLVGAMAEAAAEAIGANGLLCRAGAYYHDIGKIQKPEYFVENQQPGVSRHERLSPAMSLLIIVGHVKDGIEMAKEYRVPEILRPFIAEHHGTTIVEYFYHAANKLRKPGEPEIPEAEYRYPGPKPQSRESAILMICDGIEGAVRAMTEPTPGRIETVVSEIVQKRLLDGQFDACDLTLRDLALVEKSVVKSLNSLYHARIAYPETTEKPAERRTTVSGTRRAS